MKAKLKKRAYESLQCIYPQQLNQPDIDREPTHIWPRRTDILPETEGLMFAIQEEVILSCNCPKYVIKDPKILTGARRFFFGGGGVFIRSCQMSDYLMPKILAKTVHEVSEGK